jgi:predicted alpha/beta superfamily hydrolase
MMLVPISDGSGVLDRHTDFLAPPDAQRTVDVWCPPGYAEATDVRYPVLYMHDGQNLFDPALAYGGIDWGIDEAMVRLIHERCVPGAIIVGVWNSSQRWQDYMPEQALASPEGQAFKPAFIASSGGAPVSDHYLRFLVDQVKPQVDASYRTLPDQQHTFVMGSSMGGLISLYALEQYPHVFGGAGCLSTHWPAGGELLVDYMSQHLPSPGRHKLYFDYGTATLDAEYEPYQLRMDGHLQAAGYTRDVDWMTLKFDGAEHNEAAWRARVDLPVRFLLG